MRAVFYSDDENGGYLSAAGCADRIKENIIAGAEYIRIKYSIPSGAYRGYLADQECYGSTNDTAEVEELLQSAMAQQLIGDAETIWNPELEFVTDPEFSYYLDESILTLVWNEGANGAWGTFCEVFVGDASQFRRKIVDDTVECNRRVYPEVLLKEVNSVVASTGDLYDHWARRIGVVVYDGQVGRFNTYGDTCFVTNSGDFIMKPSYTFSSEWEAEAFVKENDINFSLCFGPIIIQDGENVTPEKYSYGEIDGIYPRLAVAQIGPLHYLIYALNSNSDVKGYGKWGCTVADVAETLLAHGCPNAYILDGGQSSAVMFNNEVITPLQYGSLRQISDIIYFSSAIPR